MTEEPYRGTSPRRSSPPPGPPQGPRHSPTVGSQRGAVSYEQGTPVTGSISILAIDSLGSCVAYRNGCRVLGAGCRVQGAECRVQGIYIYIYIKIYTYVYKYIHIYVCSTATVWAEPHETRETTWVSNDSRMRGRTRLVTSPWPSCPDRPEPHVYTRPCVRV